MILASSPAVINNAMTAGGGLGVLILLVLAIWLISSGRKRDR
jgi:hypothetical protein